MPRRPAERVPKLSHHKRSGQGVVRLVDAVTGQYRDLYCGAFDTPEARAKYHRLIGEWEARGRRLSDDGQRPAQAGAVLVRHLCAAYKRHLEPVVSPSRYGNVCNALDVLCGSHGDLNASMVGPKKIKALRVTMLGMGWARKTINDRTRAIVAAFKWAASEELVSPSIYAGLAAIPNLKPGELPAREPKRVPPVPDAHINAVMEHLPRQVRAMIRIQLATGMRPGEVCAMRPCDLDTTGAEWAYKPSTHKNTHRGIERVVWLGPIARREVEQFIQGGRVDAPLFSPREAYAEQKAEGAAKGRRENQPPTPRKTDRVIGDGYTTDSYRRAIHRACDKAGIPRWSVHRLRHNAATDYAREFGPDIAALVLGHGSMKLTDAVYAQRDAKRIKEAVSKIG